MLRLALLTVFLLLSACADEPPRPQEVKERPKAPAPTAAPPQQSAAPGPEGGEDAASVLKRYYGLIEKGDFDGAWRMRIGRGPDRERFAANFAAYERYRATVGTPSRPVESGGWLYVEVPVMLDGAFKGGKSFGSAGSVSMRRAVAVPNATAAQRQWHIYTG